MTVIPTTPSPLPTRSGQTASPSSYDAVNGEYRNNKSLSDDPHSARAESVDTRLSRRNSDDTATDRSKADSIDSTNSTKYKSTKGARSSKSVTFADLLAQLTGTPAPIENSSSNDQSKNDSGENVQTNSFSSNFNALYSLLSIAAQSTLNESTTTTNKFAQGFAQGEALQTGVTQVGIAQAGVTQVSVTQPGLTQGGIPQAGIASNSQSNNMIADVNQPAESAGDMTTPASDLTSTQINNATTGEGEPQAIASTTTNNTSLIAAGSTADGYPTRTPDNGAATGSTGGATGSNSRDLSGLQGAADEMTNTASSSATNMVNDNSIQSAQTKLLLGTHPDDTQTDSAANFNATTTVGSTNSLDIYSRTLAGEVTIESFDPQQMLISSQSARFVESELGMVLSEQTSADRTTSTSDMTSAAQASSSEADPSMLDNLTGLSSAANADSTDSANNVAMPNTLSLAPQNHVTRGVDLRHTIPQSADQHAEFARQLASHVSSIRTRDGDYQVVLQLRPAELGPIRVEIKVHESTVDMHFRVENSDSRELVRSSIADLRTQLERSGVNSGNVDVGDMRGQHQPTQNNATRGTTANLEDLFAEETNELPNTQFVTQGRVTTTTTDRAIDVQI